MLQGVAREDRQVDLDDGITQQAVDGKIAIAHQQKFSSHRCGWNYALHALQPLHNADGVLFDGFIESSFFWVNNSDRQSVPYLQPWVGFIHYPPAMPSWFLGHNSPQALFKQQTWQDSLPLCQGLFCLSEYQAQWLRKTLKKPVSALVHPTEIPDVQFDFDRFVNNPEKKIVQVGWWLRQLNAINVLPIDVDNPLNYQKARLVPVSSSQALSQIENLRETEEMQCPPLAQDKRIGQTRILQRLSNDAYDRLFSENIIFVFLHDTSANNAVVECIARATPIVVNPLPAVVEYLGQGYPLYARTYEEAARKIQDLNCVKAAHQYLKSCQTRSQLSGDHFRQCFTRSEVYQLL